MKRIYSECGQHVILEENGKFGIGDKSGHLLLPPEYDRIVAASGIMYGLGFILCKNGRFGYVELGAREPSEKYENGAVQGDTNGCALAFVPCMYDWIEARRNGLAIRSEPEEDIGDLWFDYKSRVLYRQVRYQDDLGDFDVLTDFSQGPCIPEIKRAGADEWVRFPEGCGVDILERVRTDLCGVTCVLCAEWIAEGGEKTWEVPIDDRKETYLGAEDCGKPADEYMEYSFLLLCKNGWLATPARRTLAELYADLSDITGGRAGGQGDEAEEGKQAYSVLCKYKKRNEARQ